MMKATKKEFFLYNFFEHTGIEKHLEKMAADGWMPVKLTNFFMYYRRIEPRKLHFQVSYYPKASAFDPEPTEGEQTFREFCERTGWYVAVSSAQLIIFYNEKENPVPIATDPMLEVETIHQMAKKNVILANFLILGIAGINMLMFISGLLTSSVRLLSSTSSLFGGSAWGLLLAVCSVNLISYFVWYKKAVRAARQGEFLDTFDTSLFQKAALATAALIFAGMVVSSMLSAASGAMRFFLLLMAFWGFGLIAAVNGVKNFLKRRKVSRRKNFIITITADFLLAFLFIGCMTWGLLYAGSRGLLESPETETYEYRGELFPLYTDRLPLTAEELTGIESADYIKERTDRSSVFLGQFEMRQYARFDSEEYQELPGLEYTITVVKLPFLYDLCKKDLLKRHDGTDIMDEKYMPVDERPWGAKEAYGVWDADGYWWNQWLLCYDDRFVEIWAQREEPLTEEQMALIGERLGI